MQWWIKERRKEAMEQEEQEEQDEDQGQPQSQENINSQSSLLFSIFIIFLVIMKTNHTLLSDDSKVHQNSNLHFLVDVEAGFILLEMFLRFRQSSNNFISNGAKNINLNCRVANQGQGTNTFGLKNLHLKLPNSKLDETDKSSLVLQTQKQSIQNEVIGKGGSNSEMERNSLIKAQNLAEKSIEDAKGDSMAKKNPTAMIRMKSVNSECCENIKIVRSKSNLCKEEDTTIREIIERSKPLNILDDELSIKRLPSPKLNNSLPDLLANSLTVTEISEKYKNILICSMSHELRNPVNHINGILDIVKSYTNDEKCLKYINIAISSTEMLMSKISDILDFSLLETDTCELNPITFNIRNMLVQIEDILNLQFDHKMIVFNTYVHERVPVLVYYDYKRLKQILINLVYNALKYTEKGFVSVKVDCKPIKNNKFTLLSKLSKRENQCELIFSVADSGCGIEKKKKNQFQLFSSLNIKNTDIKNHSDMIKSSDLMGIGLAFCHKMLKKMNSELKLSSIKNIGSTFSFRLIAPYENVKEDQKREKKMISNKMISQNLLENNSPCKNNGPLQHFSGYQTDLNNKPHSRKKRAASVYQNELNSNSRLISKRITLKPIKEKVEEKERICSKDNLKKEPPFINLVDQASVQEIPFIQEQLKFCEINNPGWYHKNIVKCNETLKDFSHKVIIGEKQKGQLERRNSFDISEAFLEEKLVPSSRINDVPVFLDSFKEGRASYKAYDAKFIQDKISIESSGELEKTPNREIIEESKGIEVDQLGKISEALEADKLSQKLQSSRIMNEIKILNESSSSIWFSPKESNFGIGHEFSLERIRRKSLEPIESNPNESRENSSLYCSIKERSLHCDQLSRDTEKISKLIHTECGCPQILVVDDQIINRMILAEFGLRLGVISDQAENGQIAVQMYEKSCQRKCCGPYKMILMDLNMPVMDGVRATSKIMNSDTDEVKPKVVAVTAFFSKEEVEKCKRVGMCDFKTKPVASETYKDLLIEHLGK